MNLEFVHISLRISWPFFLFALPNIEYKVYYLKVVHELIISFGWVRRYVIDCITDRSIIFLYCCAAFPDVDMKSLLPFCSADWDYRNTTLRHEGNTGFYFVRSNSRTIEFFSQVVTNIARFCGNLFFTLMNLLLFSSIFSQTKFDDQTIFWDLMRFWLSYSLIKTVKKIFLNSFLLALEVEAQ